MNFDVEKINGLLQKEDFINKLKADFSDKGIVNTFGTEGIKLTEQDAQGFKQTVIDLSRVPDDTLNVSAGTNGSKIGIEKGIHDTCEGVGYVVGGVFKGIGKAGWGVIQVPVSLVRDVAKGVCSGLADIIK